MSGGDKVEIKKSELPKSRRKWERSPVTKVKESDKKYKRQQVKRNTRKALKNAKN
jgi:hypothetical protein